MLIVHHFLSSYPPADSQAEIWKFAWERAAKGGCTDLKSADILSIKKRGEAFNANFQACETAGNIN